MTADRGPRRGGSHELCLVLGPIRRAPPAAETGPATGPAIRPYIESMTESLPASRDAAPELMVESNGRFTDHVLPRLRR